MWVSVTTPTSIGSSLQLTSTGLRAFTATEATAKQNVGFQVTRRCVYLYTHHLDYELLTHIASGQLKKHLIGPC